MISEVLSAIRGVSVFPVITLLLFFAAFAGIVFRTLRLRKHDVQRYARMPLDDFVNEGDSDHGAA
jgi:cbb3-type cytochrome oxidase subunit 3